MNKSKSYQNLGQQRINRSYSRRGIYVNQETSKRQVETYFHSPFKDGRPNKQFINPSFVSSDLFYPKSLVDDPPKDICVRKNYIPNHNDKAQQRLYQDRMKTEQNRMKSQQKQAYHRMREHKNHTNHTNHTNQKKFRLNDPESRLKSQLSGLKNYREHFKQEEESVQMSRKLSKKPQVPIYFQKTRKDYNYEHGIIQKQKNQLSEWMKLSNELKQLKKQIRRQAINQQNKTVEKTVNLVEQIKHNEALNNRRNAELLSSILKEQIKTNQLKRQKRWNY